MTGAVCVSPTRKSEHTVPNIYHVTTILVFQVHVVCLFDVDGMATYAIKTYCLSLKLVYVTVRTSQRTRYFHDKDQ
jgi:hypothetical protein